MSKFRNAIVLLALFILVGGVGYRLGERGVRVTRTPTNQVIINREPPAGTNIDLSLFWTVWQKLFEYHIDADSLNPQDLIYGAIHGLVQATGDPYSSFLTPKENTEFKQDIGGSFEGIGAQLGLKENRVIVVAPLKGFPAEAAGIRASDWILKVDGEDTAGWTVQQAVTAIRGEKGTEVVLNILHEGETEPTDISIRRDTITVPSVESWIKPVSDITEISGIPGITFSDSSAKIAYISLSRFGDNTNADWAKAVTAVKSGLGTNGSIRGLVLDLRNNPGGYLDGSVHIASEFLKDGLVVSQKQSDGSVIPYQVSRAGQLLDIPLVVLVNKGSASASEILAGALKQRERATIVGEKTFGKGSVQTPYELDSGASLHVTTAKWLLPDGTNIDKNGIEPDIAVTLTDFEATRDAQLAKAIEELLQ